MQGHVRKVHLGYLALANCNDRLKLDITSTIMHLHPVNILTGCSSGMKRNATRVLRSQRWLHGQGTCLRHIPVQICLKRPNRAIVTTRRGSIGNDLALQVAFIYVVRMSNVGEKTSLSCKFGKKVHIGDNSLQHPRHVLVPMSCRNCLVNIFC